MKLIRFVLPYIVISPAAVAVFFIALFFACVSIEGVLDGALYLSGTLHILSQTAQNIIVASAGAVLALLISAIFMNKAVYELKHSF